MINFAESTSYVEKHPLEAGLTFLALIGLAIGLFWLVRKYPSQLRKIQYALLAGFVVLAVCVNWQMFKPQPSELERMRELIRKVEISEDGANGNG